jgi:hypothetical protein
MAEFTFFWMAMVEKDKEERLAQEQERTRLRSTFLIGLLT